MDPSRFDTLTRSLTVVRSRRHTLTTLLGGALGLLGLVARDETVAKRRHHARVPACRKLKARCKTRGDRYRCCDKINRLHCDRVGASGFRCCYDYQQVCSGAAGECCRDLRCGAVSGLSGSRCCGSFGVACRTANDCCDGIDCIGGVCNLPITCVAEGVPCPAGCDPGGSCAGCCAGRCNEDENCE